MPTPPAPTDLSALSRAVVPRPPSRWATRVLLPGLVVLAALSLVAYAARDSLRPAITVTVAPVVPRPSTPRAASDAAVQPTIEEIVQAPGWIEPDPSAIGVPALAPGVLKALLVLDGERVEAGQVVALLVDEDAVLARNLAAAQAARMAAASAEARAAVAVEEAKAEEARDASGRAAPLGGSGVMAEGDIAARRLKLASQIASVESARATVARAETEEHSARIGLEEAELALARMKIRAPVGGVVLQRLVEPGQRLMPDANNPFAGVVLRLYDPARLQVRVDVPLADAAKVRIGDAAEITTETLPGRVFKGTLTRFVHEANIQKNTVQVKVAIADPPPAAELKPDMLAKARIATRASQHSGAPVPKGTPGADGVLLVPRAALVDIAGNQASAWVVDRQTSTAVRRTVKTGSISADSAEVLDGLQPGDRVILNPPAGLRDGAKVKPADEQEGR